MTHSFCIIGDDNSILSLTRGNGPINNSTILQAPEASYYLGHSQAPTTQITSIHPSQCGDNLLWHNGIVKARGLPPDTWDTEWMVDNISKSGYNILSDIDGAFACILYKDKKFYAFRNEISPLFVDQDLNISSTKFDNSSSIDPNIVFELNFEKKCMIPVDSFTTKENPYWF